MRGGRRIGVAIGVILAAGSVAALAPAAVAQSAPAGPGPAAQPTEPRAAAPAITLSVDGRKRIDILRNVTLKGSIDAPTALSRVRVVVEAGGRKVLAETIDPDDTTGAYRIQFRVEACCKYLVAATSSASASAIARFEAIVPKSLKPGRQTKYFHLLLRREGYHIAGLAKRRNPGTDLAILAFRKVNNLGRSTGYLREIYRRLASGRGEFKPKEKRKGRYVEVDISRQVMALIVNGKARHTFHVSTGTGGTPTIRGHFRFYLKQPGYNSKRMYYSVYFIGGYATHGYDPVPTYNASHGCVRNPIPYSRFIYNWISLGDRMYTYL